MTSIKTDRTDTAQLRAAIAGLISHAAEAERRLLDLDEDASSASPGDLEEGSAQRWAAAPLVAHNTEFKRQQVTRLEAIVNGTTPPTYAEADHHNEEYYRKCSRQTAPQVAAASAEISAALLAGLEAVSDDDLLDPSRHPWLRGRMLSLQIVVRGFWHPLGHLADYYVQHDQVDKALELQSAGLVEAERPGVPDAVRGMAHYSVACVQVGIDADAATASLTRAVELNPDLIANIRRDAELARLLNP